MHQRCSFALLGKCQMVKIVATVAAWGCWPLAASCRIICTPSRRSPAEARSTHIPSPTASEASRSNTREALSADDTSYVTVKINGKTRVVPGMHFTDVKSVLDAGNVTFETEDSVTPSLITKVDENTVISISRADTHADDVSDTDIAFNTVKKETSSLPQGQEKVETEGRKGVMETTNMVTRSAGKVVSSTV